MLRVLSPARLFRRQRSAAQWAGLVSLPSSLEDRGGAVMTQQRFYGLTPRRENPLIYGGIAAVVVGASAQMGLRMYEDYQAEQARRAKEQPAEKTHATSAKDEAADGSKKEGTDQAQSSEEEAGESFFSRMFSTTYYEGGFESKMTRREAALILGVRESANEKRIKEAHRRILVKNHPDRGGSAFIASKVNEAKDFLLKGKQ